MSDVAANSVRRDELEYLADNRPYAMYFLTGNLLDGYGARGALPHWPSRDRDRMLVHTVQLEDMWASAINKAITKIASRNFTISDTDESAPRMKRAHDLLIKMGSSASYVVSISQLLMDFLTTDNGCFIEIVRASSAPASRVVGLMPLDSLRCTRTGDVEKPVIYRDLLGNEHELLSHEVIDLVDMPSNRADKNGIGFCAASRAWHTIHLLMSLEAYATEKLTGDRPTAIYIVNGIGKGKIGAAVQETNAQQQLKGATLYRGAVIANATDPNANLSMLTIPLAEIPDGFNAKELRDNGYVKYANAIGVPVQDIQPLSGQGLGTGTQTIVLDEASEGQGLASFVRQLEHAISFKALPAPTSFAVTTNDIRDKKSKAEVESLNAANRAARIASGELSADEARQLAAEADELPKEWLADDRIAAGTLSDTDKPDSVDPAIGGASAINPPVQSDSAQTARSFFARLINGA